MYRDITNITDATCFVTWDNQTIAGYTGTQVKEYKYISNKYYLTETRDYSGIPNNFNCQTLQEIQSIPSQYDFITPVFHTIAIFSAIILFYMAYKLIIYPFFRKL